MRASARGTFDNFTSQWRLISRKGAKTRREKVLQLCVVAAWHELRLRIQIAELH